MTFDIFLCVLCSGILLVSSDSGKAKAILTDRLGLLYSRPSIA